MYKAIEINKKNCTACGACIISCPVKCISFKNDELGNRYPVIDKSKCLNCGKCANVCHLTHDNFNKNISNEVYAASSTNKLTKNESASGGIATEIYSYCLAHQIHCFGVSFDKNEGVCYQEITSLSDILKCRNSKYVESYIGDIFKQIKTYLKNNEKVVFIGLPCQVSSLITYVGRQENLTTIDLLCHGVTSFNYLKQHIEFIEKKTNHKLDELSFRDPAYGTNKYRMTFKDKGNVFYNKGVYDDDVYQLGYHKALIYRENCYGCKYANKKRVGDLTISDFSGLGKINPYNDAKTSISCLIVSESENGKKLFTELVKEERIVCEKRPKDEAYLYDSMFNHPSKAHPKREEFLKNYPLYGFEKSAKMALSNDIRKNKVKKIITPIRNTLGKIKRFVLKRK